MALIKERDFMDEHENFFEAKQLMKKARYKKPFMLLFQHFNHEGMKCITTKMLQERLYIAEFTNAYQILEGFVIMNLLQKQKVHASVKYLPINTEWWISIHKELKKREK